MTGRHGRESRVLHCESRSNCDRAGYAGWRARQRASVREVLRECASARTLGCSMETMCVHMFCDDVPRCSSTCFCAAGRRCRDELSRVGSTTAGLGIRAYHHLTLMFNIYAGILTVLTAILSYVVTKSTTASHISVLQVGLGICDIFTNILLLVILYDNHYFRSYFYWFLGSWIASALFNAIALAHIFRQEALNTAFLYWHLQESTFFNISSAFSIFSLQIFSIIYSGVFDLHATNARIKAKTRQRLNTACSASLLMESIPHLFLKIMIYQRANQESDTTMIAIIHSVVNILQSLAGLATWFILRSADENSVHRHLESQYWGDMFSEEFLPEGEFTSHRPLITSLRAISETKQSWKVGSQSSRKE